MDDILIKYGLPGIGLAGCGWLIKLLIDWKKKSDKDHAEALADKDEENRKTIERIVGRMDERSDDTNKTLRENTNVLSGLKALLENRNR